MSSSTPNRTGDAIENPMLRNPHNADAAARNAQHEAQAYGLFVSQFLWAVAEPDGLLSPLDGGPDVPLADVVEDLLTEYVSDKERSQFLASLLLVTGQTAQGHAPALMAQGVVHAFAHLYARQATQQAAERGELPLV